ncbi:MAG: cytidine deaminase [Solirubrobacterales bacterium]
MQTQIDDLLSQALKARTNAYMPYSNFAVGAALECADGTIYTGCNIENASFGLTLCAERVALLKAVSEGQRLLTRILVVADEEPVMPCGACLQVLLEFAPEITVICAGLGGKVEMYRLQDLLPHSFSLK